MANVPFQSTLSLRRATRFFPIRVTGQSYFNPRSPCGERRQRNGIRELIWKISIHALLAESDGMEFEEFVPLFGFQSTLSLRRATPADQVEANDYNPFQSTLSLRRATLSRPVCL